MRKTFARVLEATIVIGLFLLLTGYPAWAALTSIMDAQVYTTKEGHTTIYWPFTGSATGTDSVFIPYQIHGMLDAAYFTSSTTAVIPKTATLTCLVKEVVSYAGVDSLIDSDVAGGHVVFNTGTLPAAVHLWPTYTIPISTQLQLEMSGALTGGGAPASGTFIMTLIPNAAKGS